MFIKTRYKIQEIMARHIRVDGTSVEVEPQNGSYFTLEELQGFVEGYIELVYLPEQKIMVLNEEGKVNWLDENVEATMIAQKAGLADIIVGNVLIINQDQIR